MEIFPCKLFIHNAYFDRSGPQCSLTKPGRANELFTVICNLITPWS